jgi:hypothetical protein
MCLGCRAKLSQRYLIRGCCGVKNERLFALIQRPFTQKIHGTTEEPRTTNELRQILPHSTMPSLNEILRSDDETVLIVTEAGKLGEPPSREASQELRSSTGMLGTPTRNASARIVVPSPTCSSVIVRSVANPAS